MSRDEAHSQIAQLTIALGKEVLREPAVLFWGIVFPLLMALGLGVAFTQKPDVVRTVAWIDGTVEGAVSSPHKPLAAPVADSLERQGISWSFTQEPVPEYRFFVENPKLGKTTYVLRPSTWSQAMVLLKRGQAQLVMEVQGPALVYHFDPLNPESQLTHLTLSGLLGNGPKARPGDQVAPLQVSGTRYVDFLIPGLMAMGIMMSCMWGVSYGIIEKRSRKLLRRMIATPMKKRNFLVALVTVRVAMNVIEAGLLFLFAFVFFDVALEGSVLAFLAVFFAGNVCFSGLAIFVSSRTAKTEVGNGLINAVVMPMMVLSGIFFSYHNFPDWAVPIIEKLPLTLLADSIRSVFVEGAGFAQILVPTGVLAVIGIATFFAGLKMFRWY